MLGRKNKSIIKFLLLSFLVWVLTLICISFIGLALFPNYAPGSLVLSPPGEYQEYLLRWATWDGGHFRGIAEAGYKQSQTAFFPLFPIFIKFLMLLGIHSLYGSIFISVISGFVGLFFLYKLLLLDFKENLIRKTIFFLLIYPTSFIFLAAYSEGLFFALSVTSFYFARIKQWKIAYVLAGLSAVTRFIGIAVIIALFVERFVKGNSKNIFFEVNFKSFLVFSLSLVPLVLYSLFLQHTGKGYLSFLFDELYWGRKPTLFWDTIFNSISVISNFKFNNITDLLPPVNFTFLILLLILFIYSYKILRKSYRIYFLLSVLIPLSSGTLTGIHRYSLVIFPVFLALSSIKNKSFIFCWIIFSSFLLGLFLILYINGFPID